MESRLEPPEKSAQWSRLSTYKSAAPAANAAMRKAVALLVGMWLGIQGGMFAWAQQKAFDVPQNRPSTAAQPSSNVAAPSDALKGSNTQEIPQVYWAAGRRASSSLIHGSACGVLDLVVGRRQRIRSAFAVRVLASRSLFIVLSLTRRSIKAVSSMFSPRST